MFSSETNGISCFFSLEMVDGCLGKLVSIIEENSMIIAGVAIGIAALEVHHTFHLSVSQNFGLCIYINFYYISVCLQDTQGHAFRS